MCNRPFLRNRQINHTHEGSIGNLCNDKIRQKMDNILARFTFKQVNDAIDALVK